LTMGLISRNVSGVQSLTFPGLAGCKARPLGGLSHFWALVLQLVDDSMPGDESPASQGRMPQALSHVEDFVRER
jgi:hypothetical protein